MLTHKFHSLIIPFPKDLHIELFSLYKNISQKFANKYLNEKSYLAHITIGVLWLKDIDTDQFVEACSKTLADVKRFDVIFSKLVLSSDQRYIFLNFDKETNKILFGLRERFMNNIKGFKIDTPDKYQERFETFNERQKELLRTTGSPHEYEPHLSIAKLESIEAKNAIEELDKNTFSGRIFTVTKFYITGQSEDLENEYPILKTVEI